MNPLLIFGALGVGAYALLKKPAVMPSVVTHPALAPAPVLPTGHVVAPAPKKGKKAKKGAHPASPLPPKAAPAAIAGPPTPGPPVPPGEPPLPAVSANPDAAGGSIPAVPTLGQGGGDDVLSSAGLSNPDAASSLVPTAPADETASNSLDEPDAATALVPTGGDDEGSDDGGAFTDDSGDSGGGDNVLGPAAGS
jgi:hypothetical protein